MARQEWWKRKAIAAIYSCANNRFKVPVTKESVLLVDLSFSEEEARGFNGESACTLFVK